MATKNEDWDAIKAEVDANGGVITLEAGRLRDAYGAGRLTERINLEISNELAARALGHVPYRAEALPTYQWNLVRVYDKTSAIGKVIEASHNPGDEEDERLREAVDSRAAELLSQVRALVAD